MKHLLVTIGLFIVIVSGCTNTTLPVPKADQTSSADQTANLRQQATEAYSHKHYAKALSLFTELAKQGDASAQYKIGYMYGHGQGVSKDHDKAGGWYLKAAKQGDAKAQFHIGYMLEHGVGLAKPHYGKAARWYLKAAKQGYAPAQNNIGSMFEHGRGTIYSPDRAAKWYHRAAIQGNITAMENLAHWYDEYAQNSAEAIKWYGKAASLKNFRTASKHSNNKSTIGADAIKKALASSLANQHFTWRIAERFDSNYFNVFYENGLMIALPSLYSNRFQELKVGNYENFEQNCKRDRPEAFSKLIWVYRSDVDHSNRLKASIHKDDVVVGRLNKLRIDGRGHWHYPTLKEAQHSKRIITWQYKLCYATGAGRSDMRQYSTPTVATYTAGGTMNGFWAAIGSSPSVYTHGSASHPNDRWVNDTDAGDKLILVPVRAASDMEYEVFSGNATPTERIVTYAQEWAQQALTPKKRHVDKPELATLPDKPKLEKGEFETTAMYNKRVAAAMAKWKKQKQTIDTGNDKLMARYDMALSAADTDYQKQIKKYKNPDYRHGIYKQAIEKAITRVLGRPYFRDVHYKADTGIMNAVIFSAQQPAFSQAVHFSVPLKDARDVKHKLLDGEIVPAVIFDSNFKVASTKMVNNNARAAMAYAVAKKKDSQAAYQTFIQNYPSSDLVKKANAGISRLKAEAARKKKEREAREAKAAQKRRAERAAEAKAYNTRKHVGDLVCRPARIVFGLFHVTIKAYVEHVDGNRIQLRINDLGGQTNLYLHGSKLRTGALIWDQYNQWKACQ